MVRPLIDAAKLSPPGFRAFLKVCELWGLDDVESSALLGVSVRTLSRWRTSPPEVLGMRPLERISHVIAIFHALGSLFQHDPHARDTWVIRPNSAELFSGASALTLMMDKSNRRLRAVRMYLDCEIGRLGFH